MSCYDRCDEPTSHDRLRPSPVHSGEGSGAMAPHFMSFIFFGVHRALGVRPAVEAAFATEVGTQEDLLNRLLAPNAVRQGA